MKRLSMILAFLFVFRISAFAQMGNGHDGGMMGNGWGWGMGFGLGWVLIIVIAIFGILGVVYMMKRK